MQRYDTALVAGLGESGEAAAELLLREGSRVVAADSGAGRELDERAARLRARGADVRLGCATAPAGRFAVCVISPGIPPAGKWMQPVLASGTPLLSELDLGWSRLRGRTLAITGSNGKSTLVKLCTEALEKAGLRARSGANYGTPASALALDACSADWFVLEVSSFQLETVGGFRPDVGVLLNCRPNHLDRHGDMATYIAMKMRMFGAMRRGDTAVVPADMDLPWVPRARAHAVVTFGLTDDADCVYRDGTVSPGHGKGGAGDMAGRGTAVFTGTRFANPVMGLTAAAAVAAIRACGQDAGLVADAARSFVSLAHRMEEVAEVRGVRFVDDSKATNLAAMAAALEMVGRPTRLIAGGRLKENEFSAVKKVLASRAAAVYLMGESEGALCDAWRDAVKCSKCGDMRRAVSEAWAEARPGEAILLSPGCASFDQFDSFEDRGEKFRELVSRIVRDEEGS